MSPALVYLLISLGPALVIMVPMQVSRLRAQAKAADIPVAFTRIFVYSLASIAAGLVVGVGVGYAVMFGPSHITGDFIGLPWFTSLPGLGVGLWTTGVVIRRMAAYFLAHSAR